MHLVYFIFLILFAGIYTIYSNSKNILHFYKISNNYFITSVYFDYRISSLRVLFAATLRNNCSVDIKINGKYIKNYKQVIYDDCTKFDKDFDLKYGNIIIPSKIIPSHLHINKIRIKVANMIIKQKYFLSVCITTMYNYDALYMLMQLFDIYIELGVNHFTIYYSSSSVDVLNILNKYKDEKKLNLILWDRNNNSIRMRNYGQYIKTNDCLYRYLGISKYIINTDLDEIIIPLKYNTLTMYIKFINHNFPNTTLLLFSSKMFIKNEKVDRQVKINKQNYLKLHKITDVNLFSVTKCCYSFNIYKKYIIHVNDMVAVQVHYAWKGNINVYNVPYSQGYSRHTRRVVYFLNGKNCKRVEYDYNLSKLFPNIYLKYLHIIKNK